MELEFPTADDAKAKPLPFAGTAECERRMAETLGLPGYSDLQLTQSKSVNR